MIIFTVFFYVVTARAFKTKRSCAWRVVRHAIQFGNLGAGSPTDGVAIL